ncbi:DUF2254 domain-containing protein [Neobacillus sp. D3-1R]|uniref:DUF2254 domain-containing protein n=1 Tax=Neobacillus sp. D3-1R TaxID=3445778 RepID=UPI003F9EE2E2
MIQRVLLKIKNSIWLIPGFYCVLSLVIAIGVIMVDTRFYKQAEMALPDILLTSVDLSQTILGTIAGSLLTMTTLTFSTIMVVLTTYSSQFSPRTLRNFVTNRVTMRVLGIFMGGFVYSIFSLLFMKSNLHHPVISSCVGVIFALVCLAFFAHFIHHVATFIQVSNLIDILTEDVLKIVESKINMIKQKKHVFFMKDVYLIPPSYQMKTKIHSPKHGYLQLLDYDELLRLAVEKDQIIEINQKIGQFISTNHSILTVYHRGEELEGDYQPIITVGRERTTMQDEEFALRKIVEITLRAISPAINDPNTAIDCIHHLGLALGEVCRLDGHYLIYNDEQMKARVIVPQKPFEEILYLTFYQISHYGREDISVILAVFDALMMIVEKGSQEIKRIVWGFSHYLLEGVSFKQLKQLDQKNLQDKISKLKCLCQMK